MPSDDNTKVTVYTGTQVPHVHAAVTALRLGLSPVAALVRVVTSYVGGGFGSRVLPWYDSALAAAAARKLNRPVKLVLAREQVFTVVGHRSQVNQTLKLGASRDGVLNAVSHVSDAEMPAVGGWLMLPAQHTSAMLYKTPNLHLDQRQVTLDQCPGPAARRRHRRRVDRNL